MTGPQYGPRGRNGRDPAAATDPRGTHSRAEQHDQRPDSAGLRAQPGLVIHPLGCILPTELNGRLDDVGDPHVFF